MCFPRLQPGRRNCVPALSLGSRKSRSCWLPYLCHSCEMCLSLTALGGRQESRATWRSFVTVQLIPEVTHSEVRKDPQSSTLWVIQPTDTWEITNHCCFKPSDVGGLATQPRCFSHNRSHQTLLKILGLTASLVRFLYPDTMPIAFTVLFRCKYNLHSTTETN